MSKCVKIFREGCTAIHNKDKSRRPLAIFDELVPTFKSKVGNTWLKEVVGLSAQNTQTRALSKSHEILDSFAQDREAFLNYIVTAMRCGCATALSLDTKMFKTTHSYRKVLPSFCGAVRVSIW